MSSSSNEPALYLVVSEFVILSLACFFLLRYYKNPLVTFDVSISVYLSWVLGFTGILLIPFDISTALSTNVSTSSYSILESSWKCIYWSTFILAWAILPLQLEYHSSGHFTFIEKIKDSAFKNLRSGVIALAGLVIYIIYMAASSQSSPTQVVSFLMALGNTYGVLLIIVLLGHGLVGLPKRLWQLSNYDKELERLYASAPIIEETYQDCKFEIEDCEVEVEKALQAVESRGLDRFDINLIKYSEILKHKRDSFSITSKEKIQRNRKFDNNTNTQTSSNECLDYNEKNDFVKLHARLLKAHIQWKSSQCRWFNLINKCRQYEILLSDSSSSHPSDKMKWCEMPTELSLNNPNQSSRPLEETCAHAICAYNKTCSYKIQSIHAYLHHLWMTRIRKSVFRVLAILFVLASILILWSEMLISSDLESPLGLMMGAYHMSSSESTSSAFESEPATLIQGVSFFFLAYMSICTYWSLFRINLGWSYSLQGPQQSTPSSLIFNAEYFSRLQFTLGYNFLMILHVPKTSQSAFHSLMNNIAMIPVFGTSFNVYVPLTMILVALITFFNGYARLWRLVGVESEEVHSSQVCCCGEPGELSQDETAQINAGKVLVQGERRRQEKGSRSNYDAKSKDKPLSSMSSSSGIRGNSCIFGDRVDLEENDEAGPYSSQSGSTNNKQQGSPYPRRQAASARLAVTMDTCDSVPSPTSGTVTTVEDESFSPYRSNAASRGGERSSDNVNDNAGLMNSIGSYFHSTFLGQPAPSSHSLLHNTGTDLALVDEDQSQSFHFNTSKGMREVITSPLQQPDKIKYIRSDSSRSKAFDIELEEGTNVFRGRYSNI